MLADLKGGHHLKDLRVDERKCHVVFRERDAKVLTGSKSITAGSSSQIFVNRIFGLHINLRFS